MRNFQFNHKHNYPLLQQPYAQMHATTKLAVCPVRYCGRLVAAALSPLVSVSRHFDARTYCSKRCAALHSGGEDHAPLARLITCNICVEDKPLTDYVHHTFESFYLTDEWNIAVPPGCLKHIAPELLGLHGGVCMDCLRSHILTQFETRGAINISCVEKHRTYAEARSWEDSDLMHSHDWLPYAHQFLPLDLHDHFYQQLFDHFIHSTTASLWNCPAICGYSDGIIQPNNTRGFPHVECPGCHDRFCANCKVPWHKEQTCQQYRATHPELRDENEARQLHEMAKLGARRCPCCQVIIVKDGGCDHMFCEQCHYDFVWTQAERVVPTFVPAPKIDGLQPTFRGWDQLRRAQQEHINRNNIVDAPFNIGNAEGPQHEEGIFFYDPQHAFWSPELCELDNLAGRAAGKRYVRAHSHDRDGRWAFAVTDSRNEGSDSLHLALVQAINSADRVEVEPGPPNAWGGWGVPEEGRGDDPHDLLIAEGVPDGAFPDFDRFEQDIVALDPDVEDEPVHVVPDHVWTDNPDDPTTIVVQGGHADDPDPAAPALAALDRMIADLIAQEAAEADQGGDDGANTGGEAAHEASAAEGNDTGDEANNQVPLPFVPTWGPSQDDIDRMIDQMFFGGMQAAQAVPGGAATFHFGFGVAVPPAHLFQEGEEFNLDRDLDSE